MTKQDILHIYGQSVYQIRLEVAMRLYGGGYNGTKCLEIADEFVTALLAEDTELLQAKFP